jgi:hypothetical protein
MPSVHPPVATLRLFSKDLIPDEVSRILAMSPDSAAPAGGGLSVRGDRSRVPAKVGTWFITTRGKGLKADPAIHLSWLVDLVFPKLKQLKEKITGLRAELSLLVHDQNFDPATLPPDLLVSARRIGDLEVEVPERAMDVILPRKGQRASGA